jgi:hypothetical protein
MMATPVTVIDTCQACRKPIVLAGETWAGGDGTTTCPAGPDTVHVPVSGTPITTPLRELLILMAEDAAVYRQPEPSTRCPDCASVVEDRCDQCAADQSLADEFDAVKARVKAVTTDAEALSVLAAMATAIAGIKEAA